VFEDSVLNKFDEFNEPTPMQLKNARKIVMRRNFGLLLGLLYVPSIAIVHELFGSDRLSQTVAIIIGSL
jgi:hypothetical protein